jgi:ABC-type nickel/cobalt efflux system permease component RcnA
MDTILAVYATAITIGAVHGIEPGHGWPVAAALAVAHRRPRWYGLRAASILAGAHLISSFALVAVYSLARGFFDFQNLGWVHYVAGTLLIIMAIVQWWRTLGTSHHHHHHGEHEDHGPPTTLWGLAGFAFALGFVHEEEFAIIGLAVNKTNAWALMTTYALSVTVSLVVLTLLSIATLQRFEKKLGRYEKHLPRVSAVVLFLMGLAYILRIV